MKTKSIIALALFLIFGCATYAQRGGGRRAGYGRRPYYTNKVVIVKRSPYRPRKIVVFHPVWGPKFAFYRRWVFWPGYNIYWDNWRNTYFFWNGGMWISTVSPPPAVVNINIQNEKHYEMKETEDDVDDVYKNNSAHQKEYK
jgi:hypothetical protein